MVTVMNGVVNYTGVAPGSTAQLVCNHSYTPGEDSYERTCINDGNWSGGTQTCVQLCMLLIVVMIFIQNVTSCICTLSFSPRLWDVLHYWCCCWYRGPNHTGLFSDHRDCCKVSSQRYVYTYSYTKKLSVQSRYPNK